MELPPEEYLWRFHTICKVCSPIMGISNSTHSFLRWIESGIIWLGTANHRLSFHDQSLDAKSIGGQSADSILFFA